MKLLVTTLLLSSLIGFSVNASAVLPPEVDGQPLPTLAPMLERVQRSIVNISSEVVYRSRSRKTPFYDDPFFRQFFNQQRSQQRRQNIATGVIVDATQGYILTNHHSVVGASKITVTLADGRETTAQIIGSDKITDIALVKIDLPNLIAVQVGDSEAMRVGDFVVSVGDPLGNQNIITSGLISALGNNANGFQKFIQSDAGYGSGVLVNLRGELIGLNISKVAQTAGNTRIGFSTPSNLALKVKDQIVQYGMPQRGFLAVQVQDLTTSLAAALDINESRGAVITSVSKDTSAAKAGIKVGDVVLAANNKTINRGNDLRLFVGNQFAGDDVELLMLRDGEQKIVSAVLESSSKPSRLGTMIHHQLEGATFNEVDSKEINVNVNVDGGILATRVRKGSVAWNHGVRTNDLIVSANRKEVSNLSDFRQAIKDKDVLMLNIVRDNAALFLLLQ